MLKISGYGGKTGAPSYNTHTSACPTADEAGCRETCYVNGTYMLYKQTVSADLLNLEMTLDLLAAGKEVFKKALAISIRKIVANAQSFRIHERGDFLSPEHFQAWMEVAKLFPRTHFWAYTKSYHAIGNTEIPANVTILISLSVNDKERYHQAAWDFANERGLSIAYASALKKTAMEFSKEAGLPILSCPEQLVNDKNFTCQDCRLCWEYPKRFIVFFKAHGKDRAKFKDWQFAKKG